MSDHAVPNLPARDLSATTAFYRSFGFDEDYRDEGWLILRRGDLTLEFFPFPDLDPTQSSFMCSLRVDDVDELYASIANAGVREAAEGFPRLHAVSMQAWGQRVGFLVDIDGTQLALIENHP